MATEKELEAVRVHAKAVAEHLAETAWMYEVPRTYIVGEGGAYRRGKLYVGGEHITLDVGERPSRTFFHLDGRPATEPPPEEAPKAAPAIATKPQASGLAKPQASAPAAKRPSDKEV